VFIGRYEIHSVPTGMFRLDGGAMFGVVPKALWERVAAPDEENRIRLAMRPLIAKDTRSGRVILVDTGGGDKWSPKEIERYAVETAPDQLGVTLAGLGLRDQDVTDILITHLHFDHNGGLARWADEHKSTAVPRFPGAKVWIHRAHWQHTQAPLEKDRASFLQRDFMPVFKAGLLNEIEGDPPASPFDGIRLHVAHGHTPAMLLPWFSHDGLELLYASDLFPTYAHLPVPWVMAYDNRPLHTLKEKKEILKACYDRGLLLATPHDPKITCARIADDGKRPVIQETVPL
jgi:glyoxylase-like metal-dependent hydrolase (beta-lactamase superfamily II)